MKPVELKNRIERIIAEETSPVCVVVWPDEEMTWPQIAKCLPRILKVLVQAEQDAQRLEHAGKKGDALSATVFGIAGGKTLPGPTGEAKIAAEEAKS